VVEGGVYVECVGVGCWCVVGREVGWRVSGWMLRVVGFDKDAKFAFKLQAGGSCLYMQLNQKSNGSLTPGLDEPLLRCADGRVGGGWEADGHLVEGGCKGVAVLRVVAVVLLRVWCCVEGGCYSKHVLIYQLLAFELARCEASAHLFSDRWASCC